MKKKSPTSIMAKRLVVLIGGLALAMAALVVPAHKAVALEPDKFFAQAAAGAQAGEKTHGVPASVALAQAALESAWGESSLTKEGNAYFGIKCSDDLGPFASGCIDKVTTECDASGKCWKETASFRTYDSAADSFKDHGDFLKSRSRYAAAFTTDNADDFIREVHKAGYATDPNYSTKIIDMMQKHNLYKYNADGGSSQPSNPTLESGDTGAAVKKLQEALKSHGYSLSVDGSFGPATEKAVRDFQSKKGLEVDGIVGPATWGALLGES